MFKAKRKHRECHRACKNTNRLDTNSIIMNESKRAVRYNYIYINSLPLLGLVGPILINGEHVSGYVVCPFATTEGALVASATRGAALLTRSGGVKTKVIEQSMMRSPVFVMKSVVDAEALFSWALMNKSGIQEQVKLYSQHTVLLDVQAQRFGRSIVIVLKFSTSDAAGQNMVTTATWYACKWLVKTFEEVHSPIKVERFFVESLLSGDKRLAWVNLYSTRGIHVIAEAWIPDAVMRDTFKV